MMDAEQKELTFLRPEYKTVGVYELSFNEKNVRKLTKKGFERLKSKVIDNIYEPLKVWAKDMTVLSGNQRLAVIRHLIEEDGYDIPEVDVALYDVSERVARFIEIADNEHDGEYDFDKLIEEWDEISELGLDTLLDPKVTKKLEVKLNKEEDVPPPENEELTTVTGEVEVERCTIKISNVPKTQMDTFSKAITRVSQVTGLKREWDCMRVMLALIDEIDGDQISDCCEGLFANEE